MTAADDSTWAEYVRDAASLLDVRAELDDALPQFLDRPFDEQAQQPLRDLLNSPRMSAASDAAQRIRVV